MIDKVYRYMKSCHMIPPGRRILVAVSFCVNCKIGLSWKFGSCMSITDCGRVRRMTSNTLRSIVKKLRFPSRRCEWTRQDTLLQMDCLWKKRHVICGMKRSRRLLKSGTRKLIIPNAVLR